MGLVHANIELINTEDITLVDHGYKKEKEIRRVKIKALVDSGAFMLCINEEIRNQLGLKKIGFESATLANNTIEKYEIVGPVTLLFENRNTICRAIVLPGKSEVLLGAIPMEDMDVLIDPKKQKLIVNPEHPFMAQKSLK
jgi:clan AA aspartic protease